MLHYWTRWRLDRGKVSSPVEQFIVELFFKLGRKRPVLAKEKVPYGVDVPSILRKRMPPTYILNPAVYRTMHGESKNEAFGSMAEPSPKG